MATQMGRELSRESMCLYLRRARATEAVRTIANPMPLGRKYRGTKGRCEEVGEYK